ncbi:MAG: TMEM165/GDT1 family protein [Promethearchaeota archaeon]
MSFNFEAFLISFGLIFLAELGDKTQLMVITIAVKKKSPFKIGIATSIGIFLVAIIGLILGISVSMVTPIFWIKIAGVIVFFLSGI